MREQAFEGTTYGFLTAVESGSHGVFGGYLLVDALGRPVEFHCTAPVKVSRAQQILYGPTLTGHLHGRQIGGALLEEAGSTPVVVLTDSEAMLHVRPHTSLPVVLVRRCGDEASGDGARYKGRGLIQVTGKDNYFWFASSLEITPEAAAEYMQTFEGAAQSACWYWENTSLNKLADAGDILTMTKRINGGTIGLADRQKHYAHALHVLGA